MKTYCVVSCLLAVAALATANPPMYHGQIPIAYAPVATAIGSIPNPNYGFNYAVNDPSTGDNKAQWEARDGDVVKGAYSLVEPDGTVRLVEYAADALSGFNAVVKRIGPAVHPVSAPVIAKPLVMETIAPVAHRPVVETVGPVIEANMWPGAFAQHGSWGSLGHFSSPIIAAPLEWPLLLPAPSPMVSVQGSTYGKHGHLLRRWAAGPISLDGKTLTIRTKH